MYTGALAQVSNRETWSFSAEITDEDGVAVNLTGATIKIAVREPESLQPRITYTSGDGRLTITAPLLGTFELEANLDPGTFPPGQYEVGVLLTLASGEHRQLIVATLPIVDGVVSA